LIHDKILGIDEHIHLFAPIGVTIMSTFSEFLLRNTVRVSSVLPLVHTTPAFHLEKMWQSNQIVANPCDVFEGEDLSYFFVGRPAYKYKNDGSEAEDWELPCCFVFEFSGHCSMKSACRKRART
jgi:hypothetical protein